MRKLMQGMERRTCGRGTVTQTDVSRFTQSGYVMALDFGPVNWVDVLVRQDRITANFVEINGGAGNDRCRCESANDVEGRLAA